MSITALRSGANSWSAKERTARAELAAVYQSFGHMGMDDLIFTHITARVPGEPEHFLINPFGLMYEEITASNLVKINHAGEKVEESEYEINYAGFIIHGAVHEGAPHINAVVHLHTDSGVAVACQKEGLQPISQFTQFAYGGIAYHDYEGLAFYDEEKPRLLADLGDANMLILRNHGTLTVGRTIAEAFFHMYNLERACRVQVLAQASGNTELLMVPEAVQAKLETEKPVSTWYAGYGEMELAAWMRKLDRLGSNFRE